MQDRGLSRLQREILQELWRVYQQDDPLSTMLLDNGKTAREWWGVQWAGRHVRVKRRGQNWTGRGQSASQRAADSRALRRLEQRGLIERQHRFAWRDGPYTNYVRLTPDGIAVAQRLTFLHAHQTLTVDERLAQPSEVRTMVTLLATYGALSDTRVIDGLRGVLDASLVQLILSHMKFSGDYQRLIDEAHGTIR